MSSVGHKDMAEELNERVVRVESRLDSHEAECGRRYASLEKSVDDVKDTSEKIHSRISNMRQDWARILIGLTSTVIVLLLAVIGFLFSRAMGWQG